MKMQKKARFPTNLRNVIFLVWKLNTDQLGMPDGKKKSVKILRS